MSIDSASRDVAAHQRQIARLHQEKSREAERAADAARKSSAAAAAAARASSASTASSRSRDARRYQDEAASRQQKVASYESKIAAEQRRLLEAQKRLAAEQERETRRLSVAQQKTAREHKRQLRTLTDEVATHAAFQSRMQTVVDKLELLPQRIVVVFFALSPRDQDAKSLDEEVRSIGETIRKSEHRDSVKLESHWAVRPLDLLQVINQRRPEVVHFSGHGSARGELLFQDDQGATKAVSRDAIVQLMAATTGHIRLVFFNACHSRAQAESVVQYVPAAIGMNSDIGEEAARVFAAAFYSAVGFGLSVAKSFEQAKVALMLQGIPQESVPELFFSQNVDGSSMFLVEPGEAGAPESLAAEVTASSSALTSRRIDVTMDLVRVGNAVTSAMHHMLRTSRQAVRVAQTHGYANGVRSSLDSAFGELEHRLLELDAQIAHLRAAFPQISQPTLQIMLFRNLAYTFGAEWRWQWKTRLEGVARPTDPMAPDDPWDRFNWMKVFDGEEPDAGTLQEFVLEFSRRLDSFAQHIFAGREPNDWWPGRQIEERHRAERLLESRGGSLSDAQRQQFAEVLDQLYPATTRGD